MAIRYHAGRLDIQHRIMADSMSRYVSHDGTPRETGEGKEEHEKRTKHIRSVLCKDSRSSFSRDSYKRSLVVYENIFRDICRYQYIQTLHKNIRIDLVYSTEKGGESWRDKSNCLTIWTALRRKALVMRVAIHKARRQIPILNMQDGKGYFIPDMNVESDRRALKRHVQQEESRLKNIGWALKEERRTLRNCGIDWRTYDEQQTKRETG